MGHCYDDEIKYIKNHDLNNNKKNNKLKNNTYDNIKKIVSEKKEDLTNINKNNINIKKTISIGL